MPTKKSVTVPETASKSNGRAPSLVEQIEGSEPYALYVRNYERLTGKLDLKAIQRELLSLHSTRTIRSLDSADVLANAQLRLIDANLQNQAYRSRAVELHNQMFFAYSRIDELQENFWRWAQAAYFNELRDLGFKTSNVQWGYIASIIPFSVTALSRIDTVLKVANKIVEDLDSAGYALLRINNAVALNARDR